MPNTYRHEPMVHAAAMALAAFLQAHKEQHARTDDDTQETDEAIEDMTDIASSGSVTPPDAVPARLLAALDEAAKWQIDGEPPEALLALVAAATTPPDQTEE